MDPDAALAQIRELIVKHQTSSEEMSTSDAAELVELVDSLDEWMTKGGFLPTEWSALR
jgi:hypothetical protein